MNSTVILNVDDHEPGRYARSRILNQAGYTVLEAGTGVDALKVTFESAPSLVLLDVRLPDIDGFEVCRRIKAEPSLAHTLVLHISAAATSYPQQASGLNNGADAYLVDPVDSDVLLATINALLRMRHAELKLQESNSALESSNIALEKANAGLRLSNDDLKQFSHIASHDLQEPLRTMSSFASLLERKYRGRLDSDADECLGYISNGALRMSSLVTDLLAYALTGIESELIEEPVNIEAVIGQACRNLDQALRETSGEVVRAPMPEVLGNEAQLTQLFQNLIENSIKYGSPTRSPRICIDAETQQDGKWLFSFADNGIGLARKHWESVFSAFKRLHGRDVPGTGIGLATCRRIIHQHGGRIWIESAVEGQGSTFQFTLRSTRHTLLQKHD